MQNKNITPRNEQGLPHGYWEVYHDNGNLYWKGWYLNYKPIGRHETYLKDGSLHYIENHINGLYHGYTEFLCFDGKITKEYYAR